MTRVLLDVLVVLVAAKVAAEVAERVGLPAVVGEIVAGVAVGPSALGLVSASEVLRTLGELGVILLLLQVGLEMDLAELGAVGRASVLVAVVGVAVPFVTGYAFMHAAGEATVAAVFVGAALTATSVGITARVFGDLRALATVEARTVLGAAVADDVLGLVILTVVARLAADGRISLAAVVGVAGVALVFLLVTTGVGARLAPVLFALVHRRSRSPGTLVALALAFTLGVAEVASAAGLAPIVGAFVAGLCLSRSAQADRIRRDLTPVGHLFVPVFFLQIGIDADVASVLRPHVLALAGGLFVVAVAGKLASPAGALGTTGDKLLIGLGMIPRGEVGLIFATLGLRSHVLGQDLYAALLLVVLLTTLVTPPLLGWRFRHRARARRPAVAAGPPPEGGWLRVHDGVVDLRPGPQGALPAPHLGLRLALAAAREVARGRPGPALLDWLAELADVPLRWDATAARELFALLRAGNARSWRFLETTGMLDRALPELADAVRRRRADPFEPDPTRVLRFEVVDQVCELLEEEDDAGPGDEHPAGDGRRPGGVTGTGGLSHREWLVLAALLVDVGAGVATARQVVKRLDLGAAAEQEVALLVGESGLLVASAARADGLSEERVLQIAAHLEQPERARALYLLSLALGVLDPRHRQRLDALHDLVQAALAQPQLAGRAARNLAEQRRNEAMRLAGTGTAAAERLRHAPRPWLMAQDPAALARQARLLEPLPARDDVRVAVSAAGGPGTDGGCHLIELACRDRRGLLASVTGVLAAYGLDVLDATAATWPDGGAIEAFVVRSAAPPQPDGLRALLVAGLKRPPSTPAVPDAVVSFDDAASPWYTLCTVEAPDRPGLLHALAGAFACSGADVHSARVTTVAGAGGAMARDHFELTDSRGAKLDEATEEAIVAAIGAGVRGRRRRGLAHARPRWARTKPPRDGNNQVTPAKHGPPTVVLDDSSPPVVPRP